MYKKISGCGGAKQLIGIIKFMTPHFDLRQNEPNINSAELPFITNCPGMQNWTIPTLGIYCCLRDSWGMLNSKNPSLKTARKLGVSTYVERKIHSNRLHFSEIKNKIKAIYKRDRFMYIIHDWSWDGFSQLTLPVLVQLLPVWCFCPENGFGMLNIINTIPKKMISLESLRWNESYLSIIEPSNS